MPFKFSQFLFSNTGRAFEIIMQKFAPFKNFPLYGTFLFCSLTFCSLRDNKISADGVLVLAGALIVNRNLKLE